MLFSRFFPTRLAPGSSTYQLLGQLMRYAPRLYVLDSCLWVLIMGLPAVPGVIIREFFNTLTSAGESTGAPWFWLALFLALGLGQIVVIFAGRITKTQHRFLISALVRRNLLEQLLRRPGALPLATDTGEAVSAGEVISYLRDDAEQIENHIAFISEITGALIFAVIFIGILFRINFWITLLVFFPLGVVIALVQAAAARIKRYRRASRQATEQVTGLLGEMFNAVQAIKVAGAETEVLQYFRQVSDRRRQTMLRDRLFTATLESAFQNLVRVGTGVILLLVAQFSANNASLRLGDLALFVYSLNFVTNALALLGEFLSSAKQTEVAFERMTTLVQVPSPQVFVQPQPLYIQDLQGKQPNLPDLKQTQPEPGDRLQQLTVTDLTYFYPGSDRGIASISFTLQRGSLTVITGQVGSGKTTLLRVLQGLLPLQAGTIEWNGQRVHDPAEFFQPPRSAYTPQIPQLFSDSLKANILCGWQQSWIEIEQALAMAVFEQDISTLPEGLATRVGSKGMRLSGGQQQRVAAARMFVRQPELLILDDLSSALDVETELLLWQRLLSARTSQQWMPTCLVVSHRPTVLKQADQILVLEAGRGRMSPP